MSPLSRSAVVTLAMGQAVENLDYTFTSFARQNPGLRLQAFILGNALPQRRLPEITYHLLKAVPLFNKMPQQSDYTPRWAEQSPDQANPFAPSRPKPAKFLPGVARLVHVAKIGWQLWHGHSLGNRKCFRLVKKGL
jgi:hypothetical protein